MPTSTRALTFDDHRRELASFRYVYPVLSRRARGVSIGINLNPDKGCNFDCVYCQVDRTGERPPPGVSIEDLEGELERLLGWVRDGTLFTRPPFDTAPEGMRILRDLSFSGDGEPTAFPRFYEAVERTLAILGRLSLADLQVNVITNATLFHRPRVAEALALLDGHPSEIWAKLDAGTEGYYHQTDVTRVPFQRILSNLLSAARLRPIVIQSLFLTLDGAGPSAAEIAAWADRLQELVAGGGQIKGVQVHTVARRPPSARVGALRDEEVEAIAAAARAALPGVSVEAFYGSPRFMSGAPISPSSAS